MYGRLVGDTDIDGRMLSARLD